MDDLSSTLWYDFNYCMAWATYTLAWSYRSRCSYRMPRRGPVLVLANHESFLDPLAVGIAVRRKVHYLAKKPLFKNPLFGKYLRSVGCIPVDQDGVATEGLKTSIEVLKAGKPLLVFPEGERTWKGELQPFKPGIHLLLRKVPVPIVPVGVAGAFEAYPRGAKVPRVSPLFWSATGAAVAASVGKPIPPEKYQKMGREELLTFLFERVRDEIAEAEKIVKR